MKFPIINLTNETAPYFPPQGNGVRYLNSTGEFMEEFRRAWENTKVYFKKYEDRQIYIEEGDVSLDHYLSGRVRESVASLSDGFEHEEESFKRLRARGADYIRIRPYVEPLSSYLQWEIMSYQLSTAIGQKVELFDDIYISQARKEYCVSDFVIFDDFQAMLHNYTSEGRLVGGWVVTNSDHIAKYITLFDRMLEFTEPLSSFLKRYPELSICDAS